MGVEIAGIRTWSRLMDADIYGGAVAIGQFVRKFLHQVSALVGVKLWRQKHQPLSRETRIAPQTGVFGRIPERGTILCPCHIFPAIQIGRNDYLFVRDISACGIVEQLIGRFIANSLASSISGSTGNS
jgi:hypothetical protein